MSTTPDSDEEEFYVYAEFDENVDISQYRNIHVIGIDSKNPVIQMDDTFFTGNYTAPMGTYMFFEETEQARDKDPVFEKVSDKNLKYQGKANKFLKMEHAYVTSKSGKENINALDKSQETIDPVNFKTIQEAVDTVRNELNAEKELEKEIVKLRLEQTEKPIDDRPKDENMEIEKNS